MSTIGDRSTLDYFSIQDAEIDIKATCGAMTALSMYKGKVSRQPTEEEGSTTFDIRTIIFDLIDVELKPEIASDFKPQIVNEFYLSDSGAIVNNSYEDVLGIEHIHPLATFDEYGRARPWITNTNPEKVTLKEVVFAPKDGVIPPLGKYTIEFQNDTDFLVTQPDSSTLPGKTSQLFTSGFVQIFPNFWNINAGELAASAPYTPGRRYFTDQVVYYQGYYWRMDYVSSTIPPGEELSGWTKLSVDLGLQGTKIEFYCSYTAKGNPIRIVKNLIHKALTGRWGKEFALDTSVNVDWGALDDLELIYSSVQIHLSETNRDNSVFNPQTTDKPLRIRDILQKILDHIGCQLAVDLNGRLTVNSSFYLMPGKQLYTYESGQLSSGDTRKPSHKLFGGSGKIGYMRVKHGYDVVNDSYGGKVVFVGDGGEKGKVFEMSLPYYAQTQGGQVRSIGAKWFDIVKSSDVRLEMSMKPNWGLPLRVGDKLKVNLSVQPILPNTRTGLGEYWEIYDITKKIGGVVKVKCKMIPAPAEIEQSSLVCFAIVCESTVC